MRTTRTTTTRTTGRSDPAVEFDVVLATRLKANRERLFAACERMTAVRVEAATQRRRAEDLRHEVRRGLDSLAQGIAAAHEIQGRSVKAAGSLPRFTPARPEPLDAAAHQDLGPFPW